MNVVFLTNFMNHHQMPLCRAICRDRDVVFKFIATMPVPEDRLSLGYADMNQAEDFILRAYASPEAMAEAQSLVDNCDVLIITASMDSWLKRRLQEDKLIFQYSERIYKDGYYHLLSPRHVWGRIKKHTIHQEKKMYTLCASAFCPWDLAICGSYRNKTFKWGYFPEAKRYEEIEAFIDSKANGNIFWAARFIDWKHPEISIEVARTLKQHNRQFRMTLAGNGPLWEKMNGLVRQYGLEDCVFLPGSMTPEEVRREMEQASIFLFTSDRNEGWGAVLNESMNSGCAVVANCMIGSVPYLIKNGENGLIYKDRKVKEIAAKVEYLLDHPQERKQIGKKAYLTIVNSWNAETAAERLLALAKSLQKDRNARDLFADGVCSRAEIIPDWWF